MTTQEGWRFAATDAAEAARDVVQHEPDTPWERIPVPADAAAAAASVKALEEEFQNLPSSIRGALRRATTNAAQLSDDRLHLTLTGLDDRTATIETAGERWARVDLATELGLEQRKDAS